MTTRTTGSSPRARLLDLWWSVGLFVLTVLSRLPFQSHILYHWDSVNFAYAMREFNVIEEQPQPPGYIVYVWLCRLVDLIFHDANRTMIAIAIVSSGLTVVALYWLGKTMFDRWTGAVSALLMWSSPLFWFYGEIALPHALDALLVTVGVWWLYKVMRGDMRFLYPTIVVLGIAGGVRQQTLVFLAPLILYALWRVGWKRFVMAGILGAVVCLAWFIPLLVSTGGLTPYMVKVGEFSSRFQTTTSLFAGAGWFGLQRNLTKLTLYTAYGWGLAALPMVVEAIRRVWGHKWPTDWRKVICMVLWVAPTIVFYMIVHMGQQGLTFVFLPALMLGGAYGLACLLKQRQRAAAVGAAIVLAVHTGLFLFAPEYPLGSERVRLLSRATLVQSDRYYLDRFSAIEQDFPVEATAILASNWHHVEYYLPTYSVLRFGVVAKWELGEGNPVISPELRIVSAAELIGRPLDEKKTVSVVVFDPVLEPFNTTPERIQVQPLSHGGMLGYIVLSGKERVRFGDGSYGVATD